MTPSPATPGNRHWPADLNGYVAGAGKRSEQRSKDLAAAQQELTEAKAGTADAQDRYDRTAAELESSKLAAVEKARRYFSDRPAGLLDQVKALSALADDAAINFTQLLVRGLILLIDLSPVLLKTISPRTTYDQVRPLQVESTKRLISGRVRASEDVELALFDLRVTNIWHTFERRPASTPRESCETPTSSVEYRANHRTVIQEDGLAMPSHPVLNIHQDDARHTDKQKVDFALSPSLPPTSPLPPVLRVVRSKRGERPRRQPRGEPNEDVGARYGGAAAGQAVRCSL